jgi:S1-C subfamily serine protease
MTMKAYQMRVARRIGLALTLSLFGSLTGTLAAPSAKTPASIYKENIGRVFTIHAGDSLGTGFVLATGRIATNAHVVGNASLVEVESQDGKSFKAKVVIKDVARDFAILQFEGVRPFVTVVPLQRSGTPEIGEGVVVIGSAVGLKGTVTTGIVSQVYSNGLVQLNAAVNHGNSGGPVFDMQGRVFGIATLKIQQTPDGHTVDGLAMAIPIRWLDAR